MTRASVLGDFWKEIAAADGEWLHPEDAPFRDKLISRGVDLGRVPMPYAGDLKGAKLFVLMANPGAAKTVKQRAILSKHENLRLAQLQSGGEGLGNPVFHDEENGAFQYWTSGQRFKPWVREMIAAHEYSQSKAYRELGEKVAMIQLIPYLSKTWPRHVVQKGLPSARAAIEFVKEELIPRARQEDTGILVVRKAHHWVPAAQPLPHLDYWHVNSSPHARGGYIGRRNEGAARVIRTALGLA